jgi:hypothetical protein
MKTRFVVLLLSITFVLVSSFAEALDFAAMRPSDGPLNPLLVAGTRGLGGNRITVELSKDNPTISRWALVPVGQYVAILNAVATESITVAAPVGNGQQAAVTTYTGADTQLWKATNVIGVLWTFAPTLAPQFILQTQNGGLTIGTPLTVGSPTPGPGGVGVISSQMWVYPQR